MSATEYVVLVDESGTAVGTALKSEVHDTATPLHLAFSCYVFDASDRLLLTRRASSKLTFPGVWTNTVCGHPAPGEPMAAAVRRRLRDEVGLDVHGLRLILPEFRYLATGANGVVENELCPVFTAVADGPPRPVAAEVDGTDLVAWTRFTAEVVAGVREVSPWCVDQVRALLAVGPDPSSWPTADEARLPEAAVRGDLHRP